MKIDMWKGTDRTGEEVLKRLKPAEEARKTYEKSWDSNESMLFPDNNHRIGIPLADNGLMFDDMDFSDLAPKMKVPHIFKNVRFLHAQMSANPPTVIAKPATSDQSDYYKAAAGDKLARYLPKQYKLQEKVDQTSLSTIVYGSGILKTVFDPHKGDILSRDLESGNIELEGDISIYAPNLRNIYLDPDAKCIDEIKWIIEEIYVDIDEACARYPDKVDVLKSAKKDGEEKGTIFGGQNNSSNKSYNTICLLEYWETGLASNGYLGRYALVTKDGSDIIPCKPSPFRFRQRGAAPKITKMSPEEFRSTYPHLAEIQDVEEAKSKKIEQLAETARLPFHILTDIDVLGTVWGKSAIEYAAPLEDLLNKIDSAHLANIRAHGSTKLVTFKGANLTNISDDQMDIIETDVMGGVSHLQPPQVMPEMVLTRKNLIDAIDQVFGVNESMFGIQSREQATSTMQYATNQGNMIRRRVFNKYVMFIESIYQALLDLTIKHWATSKLISVTGSEFALDAIELKGADVDGGFDFHVDYGISFSLDPQTRYQQILLGKQFFTEAGVKPRQLLRFLRLSELESLHDATQLAENRMREIFVKIVRTGQQIQPRKHRDYANMMAYCLDYFMTDEFNKLPMEVQDLCTEHYELMGQASAMEQMGMASPGGAQAPVAGGASINPADLTQGNSASPIPGEGLGQAPILPG